MREMNSVLKIVLAVVGVIILINLLVWGFQIGAVLLLVYLIYKLSKDIIMKVRSKFQGERVEKVEYINNESEKEKVVIDVEYKSV